MSLQIVPVVLGRSDPWRRATVCGQEFVNFLVSDDRLCGYRCQCPLYLSSWRWGIWRKAVDQGGFYTIALANTITACCRLARQLALALHSRSIRRLRTDASELW